MNLEETGKLLGTCAAYDNREVDEATVFAWWRIVGDLGYSDCEEAVAAHYTESREWIMPADVRTRVKRAQRAAEGPRRLRDLLNPAAYRRQVEAADARTLALIQALIQARAGQTLAITGPEPVAREIPAAPPGRVLTDPQAEALRQVARSRERRGAEVATILQGAVDAAEATLRAILEPWLSAKAHGTTLGTQLRAAAACALRDAEKAWPREPPQRDPASTTSAHIERAGQFDYDQRRPASFGFGKVTL